MTDIEAPDAAIAARDADVAVRPIQLRGRRPPPQPAAVDDPLPEDRYLNRELSWLDFNARVLALAEDTSLRCWSGRSSWRSLPPTSTSSTWSASPV